MTDEISRIAAGLTKAHINALCPDERGWTECNKGKALSKTIGTARGLYQRGLIKFEKHLSPLTETGLEVRAHLTNKGNDDA